MLQVEKGLIIMSGKGSNIIFGPFTAGATTLKSAFNLLPSLSLSGSACKVTPYLLSSSASTRERTLSSWDKTTGEQVKQKTGEQVKQKTGDKKTSKQENKITNEQANK